MKGIDLKERKLLEAAARAARLNFNPTFFGEWGLRVACDHDQGQQYDWNPLDDGGDALQLATTLGLCVDTRCADEVVVWANGYNGRLIHCERIGTNHEAAVRRAIVVAATIIQQRPLTKAAQQ